MPIFIVFLYQYHEGEPKKAKLGILSLLVVIIIGAILLPMASSMPGPPKLVIKGIVKDAQTNEPITGARVFDDGYGPEPVWEQIRPDMRCQWGAITNSAGRYSFLTWPEHHTVKVEAPGYKPQNRSLYNGHFVFKTKDEETFDFTLEPEKVSDSSRSKISQPENDSTDTNRKYFWRTNIRQTRETELLKTLNEDIEPFEERVGFYIRDYDDGVIHCIDFDSNKIIRVPDELDIKDRNAILKWAKENDVDAMFRKASSLVSINMASVMTENSKTDKLSSNTLKKLSKKAVGSTDILYSTNDGYMYYTFKTSQGRIGVVGLCSSETEGLDYRSLLISYKLLKTNAQIKSKIDWAIEDYGQTRLLSDKEKPDIDNWVSIWGSAVKNKGRHLVPDKGLTLKALIKAAGYNKDKLSESYVELIRRSQEGNITTRSTYSRNLKTLLSGEESDIVLKPHDAVSSGYIEPSANGVEFWSGYHFGDIVEMTVNDDGAKVNMFADLDTGKLITPPDTLNYDDVNAVLRWIKDNGIDIMGETAPAVHGLVGFNMYAARVDNYFWDAGPREVTDRLMVRIDDPVLLRVENRLPVTYLIKTSKYKMGILQILGFTENPKGIKIRYKLLDKEAAPKTDVLLTPEPVAGNWQYIGQSIPPDFNDTMILAEHINLGSIGHDAEGKTFITFIRDGQEAQNRQYQFVLFKKDGSILEPDGHIVLGEGKRLEEKFTFDEPFITRYLKGFRFQARPSPPSRIDNISSQLQKGASEVVTSGTLLPSNLPPPGRYAVELDGVNDYLLVPDSPSLRLEPPFTIEMWIKTKLPPDASEYRGGWAVISKGFTVGTPRAYLTGFGINLHRFPKEPSNLHIDFCKANNSGAYSATYAGYPLTNGVSDWIHITHVFDGEYYKSAPGHPLVMGKFLIPTENPFKGLLGEVRLWNGDRTRQKLRQYKNVALTGTEPGLAACWTFEQTEGLYAYDISGNNNHARFGKFTSPDDADPKWIDLQEPSPQPDQKTDLQVEDIHSQGEGILMLEGFYSFGEGERYSKRLSQIISKAQTYIEQMYAGYENKDWYNVSEASIQVRDIFFSLKDAIEVDDAAAWEAFTKMWNGEKTDTNDVRLVDLARLKRTFEILAFVGGVYREETHQNLCTSIVNIADVADEIQKTLRAKRSAMISSHIEKLHANWAVLAEIDGIKKIFQSGFQTKDKTDLQAKADVSVAGKGKVVPRGRDYEAAKTEPQPIELCKVKEYGVGGSVRAERKLQTYVKRKYPVQLVWPLIQDASKYVVQIHGLRGSQPAKSFESVTNRLSLNELDISPGRYRWSVSVYDEQGKLMSDIETIDPDEFFAIEDPEPVEKNGKTAMIDLNHSTGHMRGWGFYNHAQYMTKELLENAGFEVQVNERDLLTIERLKSVNLLICNYYWTGWPAFRPYLKSELTAVRQFVEGGGSLLVVGCDRTDDGGNMCEAGNKLLSQFGLNFGLGKISKESGMAKTVSGPNVISFEKSFLLQLPVRVLGDDALTLLRFEAEPIAKARQFGQGRVVAAGVGMSFLDCYLADFQNREPMYIIMFYDFVRYLTRIDWKESCKQDFIEKILSRCQF